jgi:hypothetical protein
VQIAVYAHVARQEMEAADGKAHPIADATYLAFGEEQLTVSIGGKDRGSTALEVEKRASAFATAVGRIEAGEFPPRPRRFDLCVWCPYAGVCRKEYRMETDATESL